MTPWSFSMMRPKNLWIVKHKDAAPCDVVRVTAFGPKIHYKYTWHELESEQTQQDFLGSFRPYNSCDNQDPSLMGCKEK